MKIRGSGFAPFQRSINLHELCPGQQVSLEPYLANTSAHFQAYVKRGLARVAAAALSTRPGMPPHPCCFNFNFSRPW